ncbi:hypothetical protein KP509_27G026900 [Ceratopteris richardii]|uniref:VQ domain-containing protein n=1 Tax=Ceratopteris richardii TaxID=49495 RepID=A0A8T2RGF1_CERRI|nr:hypothetical protein KP509_27G026900 [Ceratopteris richardii]
MATACTSMDLQDRRLSVSKASASKISKSPPSASASTFHRGLSAAASSLLPPSVPAPAAAVPTAASFSSSSAAGSAIPSSAPSPPRQLPSSITSSPSRPIAKVVNADPSSFRRVVQELTGTNPSPTAGGSAAPAAPVTTPRGSSRLHRFAPPPLRAGLRNSLSELPQHPPPPSQQQTALLEQMRYQQASQMLLQNQQQHHQQSQQQHLQQNQQQQQHLQQNQQHHLHQNQQHNLHQNHQQHLHHSQQQIHQPHQRSAHKVGAVSSSPSLPLPAFTNHPIAKPTTQFGDSNLDSVPLPLPIAESTNRYSNLGPTSNPFQTLPMLSPHLLSPLPPLTVDDSAWAGPIEPLPSSINSLPNVSSAPLPPPQMPATLPSSGYGGSSLPRPTYCVESHNMPAPQSRPPSGSFPSSLGQLPSPLLSTSTQPAGFTGVLPPWSPSPLPFSPGAFPLSPGLGPPSPLFGTVQINPYMNYGPGNSSVPGNLSF